MVDRTLAQGLGAVSNMFGGSRLEAELLRRQSPEYQALERAREQQRGAADLLRQFDIDAAVLGDIERAGVPGASLLMTRPPFSSDYIELPKMAAEARNKKIALSNEAQAVQDDLVGLEGAIPRLVDEDIFANDPFAQIARDYIANQKKQKDIASSFENQTLQEDAQRFASSFENQASQEDQARNVQPTAITKADAEVDPVEGAFTDAMEEFIQASGQKAPEERDLDFYRKQFAEATGLDISGKPDKRAALMAFGLALMQNRAGKGFNIGNILRSVGEAGEKALPALQSAREEARANAAAAGKYALEARSADQAKREAAIEASKKRENYYIVPKGEGISGFLANADKGRLMPLNANELSGLQGNREFSSKYDILPASTWSSIVEEAMKAPEAENLYLNETQEISLFGEGADKMFDIEVFKPNPNAKNTPSIPKFSNADPNEIYSLLGEALEDTNRAAEGFEEIAALIQGGGARTDQVIIGAVSQFANKLGITPPDTELPPAVAIEQFLRQFATKNVTDIIGEAGARTISDGDRQRADKLVGELSTFKGSPNELLSKLDKLYKEAIIKNRNNIYNAYRRLDRLSGQDTSSIWGVAKGLTEEQKAELAEYEAKDQGRTQ